MKEYTFDNLSEVENYLVKDEFEIPERTSGRRTFHTEYFTLKYILSELKSEIFSEFPVILKHGDRPDFSIIYKNHTIGIEVTESIPEQLARASALLEGLKPECSILEPDYFGWDAPERTNNETIEIIKKSNIKLTGKGFVGKSIEINWVKGITSCINNKMRKLNKPEFDKLDQNWLLVYDNQVKIFFDYEYVGELLYKELNINYKKVTDYFFDQILIVAGKKIIRLSLHKKPNIRFIDRNIN